MAIPDFTPQQAEQLIKRQHPSHKRNLTAWKYMRESWRGGSEYESSNKLWMFNGEDWNEYSRRKQLSTYIPYVRAVITDRRNLIFAQPPTYDADPEMKNRDLWTAFNKNFDGTGRSRADVMSDVYCEGSLYGTMFGLLDKGAATASNLKEQIDKAEYPRLVPYRPQDFLDWSLLDGKLLWGLFRESSRDDFDPFKMDNAIVDTYLLYHRDYWIRFEAKRKVGKYSTSQGGSEHVRISVVGSDENPIGEVPLVIYRDTRDADDPVIGEISMYEIARLSQEIYNLNSNCNEQINQSIVNILILGGKGFSKLGELKLNVSTALCSDDPNANAEWLKQEVAGIQLIGDRINEKESQILRLSKIRDFLDMKDLQRVSAIPVLVGSNSLHKELSQDCNELMKFEQEVDRLYGKWEKVEPITSHKYPKSFNVLSESELLNLIKTGKEAEMPKTYLEQKKIMASDVGLPAMTEDMRKAIREEAAAMEPYKSQPAPLVPRGVGNQLTGLMSNAGNTAARQAPGFPATEQ